MKKKIRKMFKKLKKKKISINILFKFLDKNKRKIKKNKIKRYKRKASKIERFELPIH
ncbi:hypothetical protein ACT2CI_00170 [Candidatus Vidania fulgoroideorum]